MTTESPKEEKQEKVTLSKEEYEKLLEQSKELEALRDQFLRRAADYDNARKRLQKEREEFTKHSQEKLLKDLLPILDNFERALAHSQPADKTPAEGPANHALVAGIQLIWKQLHNILTLHGLKRISCEGQPFDPHLHETVDQIEEAGPEGIVVKELVAGYLLHDRVLRPAKVRIRTAPADKVKKAEEKEEELT